MDLREYTEQLFQEVLAAAEADASGGMRLDVFTDLVAQRLVDEGAFTEPVLCYHKSRGVEVSGFALDDSRPILHLFVTDYRGTGGDERLTDSQVAQSFKRLRSFVERCHAGYGDRLEESSPAFEVADLIRSSVGQFESAVLYLFSDARAQNPTVDPIPIGDLKTEYQVWDLERLFRLDTSGLGREAITVDLVQLMGRPVECLVASEADDHTVYLLALPGEVLAELYGTYGSRLLERNVRAFLQARGNVNRGLRDTILHEPERFMAFNNGISATASSIVLVEDDTGSSIRELTDLQIVNGGQTTASLSAAKVRDGADLSRIRVQTKLTVVGADTIDELVPHISQYSNTQNKVTGADFSSNDPFHVALEDLSRSIWAPAADGSQRQSHWFYERARGQYADELFRAGTLSKRRQFKLVNPPQQKFTKTDIAKFEHSWDQLPHIVSAGAEKNFREFMLRLAARPQEIDERYFAQAIAKAILFRSSERIVSAQRFGGYRANIVTYSLAKLSHATARRLDLDLIWRSQALSEPVEAAVTELCHLIFDIISHPSGRVRNIGEWCKKLDCWKTVEELDWRPTSALRAELVELGQGSHRSSSIGGGSEPTPSEQASIAAAAAIEAELWFRVSNWAKETGSLQPWQRGLAYSLGRLASNGTAPSPKQSKQGLLLLEEATRLGFA